jgi:hypothetical protein
VSALRLEEAASATGHSKFNWVLGWSNLATVLQGITGSWAVLAGSEGRAELAKTVGGAMLCCAVLFPAFFGLCVEIQAERDSRHCVRSRRLLQHFTVAGFFASVEGGGGCGGGGTYAFAGVVAWGRRVC